MSTIHNTYETQFTAENVREVSTVVQDALSELSKDKGKRLDLFVLIAGIQQAAYEIGLRSFNPTKEEATEMIELLKPVSLAITQAVDTYREENKSNGPEEVLGAIVASNVINEFYGKLRDERLVNLEAAARKSQADFNADERQDVANESNSTQSTDVE